MSRVYSTALWVSSGPRQSSQTARECFTEFVCCVSAYESAPKKLPGKDQKSGERYRLCGAHNWTCTVAFSWEVEYPNHADGIQRYLFGWNGFEQYFEILKYCSWTVSRSNLCILYKAMHLTVIYKAHWTPHMCHRRIEAVTIVTTSVVTQTHTSHSILKLCRSWFGFRRATVEAWPGSVATGAHIQTVSCALKHFKCLICKWCLLSQNQNECMKYNYTCHYLQRNSLTMMDRNWLWRIFWVPACQNEADLESVTLCCSPIHCGIVWIFSIWLCCCIALTSNVTF